jgi:hypothetical protein
VVSGGRGDTRSALPLIKGRRAVIVVVVFELLFIGYLITQAVRTDDWATPWYAVAATSLALLTGIVWWTRLRRRS